MALKSTTHSTHLHNTYKPYRLSDWLRLHKRVHPQEIELGLDRIREVALRMQVLDFKQPVITVAGTNGKGSTVAMLEAILRAGGYTTASYTSPHMHLYNERIRLANCYASDDELCEAFEVIEEKRSGISLSFFEFSTLAALYFFKRHNPDVILLETGLGGRLDAVNIIDADLAIITSIGIDHTEWLGDNRESIGYEKAGITRSGKPCICGDPNPPESIKVFAKDCPLILLNDDFSYRKDRDCWQFDSAKTHLKSLPLPALFGDIQLQNASCVLMALECLAKHFSISHDVISEGLKTVRLPGRFQVMRLPVAGGEALSIFDISHNPQGVEVMVSNLKSLANGGKLHAVFAILSTKDVNSVVQIVAPLIDCWYLAELDSNHTLALDKLQTVVSQHRHTLSKAHCFHSVPEAYNNAMLNINAGDFLLVFGSTMTVAEALGNHSKRTSVPKVIDGTTT